MRLIDADALIDALMTYTWRDEDDRLIDDAEEKREYIKRWMPELPTFSGWVSVKDRLPEIKTIHSKYGDVYEESAYVLVYVAHGLNSEIWPHIGVGYICDGRWAIGSGYFKNDTVTHWMPLPEPPKEDDA